MIEQTKNRLEEIAKEEAKAVVKVSKKVTSLNEPLLPVSAAESDSKPMSKKEKRRARIKRRQNVKEDKPQIQRSRSKDTQESSDDAEEDDAQSRRSKKHGSRKSRKGRGRQAGSQPQSHSSSKGKKAANQSGAEELPTFCEVASIGVLLAKWYPDMEEYLVELLSQYLQPEVISIWKSARTAIFHEQTSARKQANEEFALWFEPAYLDIQLFTRSISHFKEQGGDPVPLEHHLLRTICLEATNRLLCNQALNLFLDVKKPTTLQEQHEVVSMLPQPIGSHMGKLVRSLTKSPNDWLESLRESADDCQLHLRHLDSKREKNLSFNHRTKLMDTMKASDDIAVLFHACVLLLYWKEYKKILLCPGRMVGDIIEVLKDKLDGTTLDVLSRCQALAIESVKQQQGFSEAESTPAKAAEEDTANVLLKELKSVILGSENDSET